MTEPASSRGRRSSVLTGVVVAVALLSAPVAAGAQSDAESEREEIKERRSAVASQLDVLEASDAEIDAALDEIDGAIAAQQRALADAEAAVAEARDAVVEAEADLEASRRDVAALEEAIAEMAVASYMHPPTADLVQSLQAASFSDALLQRAYLDARAKRDLRLLDLLEEAEATAAERTLAVAAAADEAARAVEAAGAELAGLREEEARQADFARDLQGRIDAALAEAAVLADLDAELAEQIAAEQAALLARIPEPAVVPVAASPQPQPQSTVPVAPDPGGGESTTASPPVTAPPTTTPPPPPIDTSTPPLRTVGGITVHAGIADDVLALLDAAAADGITLSGWGYRSTQRQIELRIANCGPTYYDIWIRPAGSCSPPTAVPGRSLHEQGRAIDFTYAGRTITSRSSPGFQWLAANAASYGLFNLPSEPWHWSTTGG